MAIMEYRTQDGLADYGFSLEFQSGVGWRVYIIFAPSHGGQEDSTDLPYQSIDSAGRRYVDWSSRLNNLGDARSVAALWAELAQRYQRTQEQRAFYADLIQRYLHTQEQRKATPAGPNHPDEAIGAGGSGAAHQDCGSVIPHPSAIVKSYGGRRETEWSGRGTGEVA